MNDHWSILEHIGGNKLQDIRDAVLAGDLYEARKLLRGDYVLLPRGDYDWLRRRAVDARENEAAREMLRRKSRTIPKAIREAVIVRDRSICRYCLTSLGPTEIHMDHYEPDGPSTVANLVTACARCNTSKGKIPPAELKERRGMRLSGSSPNDPHGLDFQPQSRPE